MWRLVNLQVINMTAPLLDPVRTNDAHTPGGGANSPNSCLPIIKKTPKEEELHLKHVHEPQGHHASPI